MRIHLTMPFAHPYVRRGVERYVGELADWLGHVGHDVTVLATAPDFSRIETRPSGARFHYVRSGPPFGVRRWRVDELWRTLPALTRGALSMHGVDLVEAHHFPDAAVLLASHRTRRSPPYSLWLPGVARLSYFDQRPLYRLAATTVMRNARPLIALSRYAAAPVAKEFSLDAEVLPLGVNTSLYDGERPPTSHPWIICTAAAEDSRKRVDVLLRAFVELSNHHPTARLLLAPPRAQVAEAMVRRLDADVRGRVTVRVPDSSEKLAELYRRAAISVLPSVDEAFGLVIVESLAAGTPVVATTSGAAPEMVGEAIGRLTPPDDAPSMARAMLEVLELATDRGTAESCRAAARRWDWDVIGPRWLALHERWS